MWDYEAVCPAKSLELPILAEGIQQEIETNINFDQYFFKAMRLLFDISTSFTACQKKKKLQFLQETFIMQCYKVSVE